MSVLKGGFTTRITPTEFEQGVFKLIQDNFKDSHLFGVKEERRLYNPETVEEVWEQNIGKKPHACEVYFNGEYVCTISSSMQPPQALKFLKNAVYDLMLRTASNKGGKLWT
jgi:hypothetical protein